MDPADRTVAVTGPESIILTARAFDENPHDFLRVIWVGEELQPRFGNVARQTDVLEEDELYYRFDVVEFEINSPCNLDVQKEVVTVYVADAPLEFIGDSVQLSDPAAGGFITTFTWILDFQPGACL